MELKLVILLHTIISLLSLAVISYFYGLRVSGALWRENIVFVGSGINYYIGFFLLGRILQGIMDYGIQLVLHLVWSLPFYHQLSAPWPLVLLVIVLLALPLIIWMRVYWETWHSPTRKIKSPKHT